MRNIEEQTASEGLGFRGWLLLLTLVTGMPMAAFSIFSLYEHVCAQEEKNDALLQRYALAAAAAIDTSIAYKVEVLEALAATTEAGEMDIQRLYERARAVESALPDVQDVTLVDGDGNQLFSTLFPLGTPLPKTGDAESIRQVLEDLRPSLSGMYARSIVNQRATALGAPLVVKGGGVYVLRMVTRLEGYEHLLLEQFQPEGWTLTLFDADGVILACSSSTDMCVGQVVPAELMAASGTGVGVEAMQLKGQPVRFAVAPVADWGWHVAVHVPLSTVRATMFEHLFLLAASCLFFLVCGFAGAWLVSRRLAAEVELAARSCLLPDAGGVSARPTLVRELRTVGTVLAAAREREEEALRDSLTGLAGRTLFLRHAQRMLEHCSQRKDLRCAIMYIDLDGFKQVNDRYGHLEGDAVLRHAARLLASEVRTTDVLGRIGGDEFVLCLAFQFETAIEVAGAVAARIVTGMEGIGRGIGCSVGVALTPPGGASDYPRFQALLEHADKAMYMAKREGKNSYRLVEVGEDDAVKGQDEL